MMLLALTILCAIILFILAFLSPRKGRAAQRYMQSQVKNIVGRLRNSPKPVKKLVGKPTRASQKTLHQSAELGHKARDKAPF